MAQEKVVPAYEVVVRGQYHSASGKDRILKTFGPVTFYLPETAEVPAGRKLITKKVNGKDVKVSEPQTAIHSITKENVALYVVQRRLLPTWLVENMPDAVSFRTCYIVPGTLKRVLVPASSVAKLQKPVSEMSLVELKAFCQAKGLSTQVSAFKDVLEARAAVEAEMAGMGQIAPSAPEKAQNSGISGDVDPETPVVAPTAPAGVLDEDEDPADSLI